MRALVALALALTMGGCSWMQMRFAPDPYRQGTDPKCTTMSSAPTTDFVLAGGITIAAAVGFAVVSSSSDPKVRQNAPDALADLALAGLFLASGLSGNASLGKCSELTHNYRLADAQRQEDAKHAPKLPFSIVVVNGFSESLLELQAGLDSSNETFGPWRWRAPANSRSPAESVYARNGQQLHVSLTAISLGEEHDFAWNLVPPRDGATLVITYSWDPALNRLRATTEWR